ncbi:ada2p [Lichtheimia corymbifera JMRC:FSU:9682]|uniref:Transcriptional adapter 2 n=1 Tax=Lichtheimia corymbifera JMRC:FSU:9682 TaxID=1263082 RepID=A0A068RUB0_9FUNG|nr:ada2p [Lichtheimia corymbifera JMRC:FSU:9682]
MTITHRSRPVNATVTNTTAEGSQIDDKEPPKYHCDACSNDVTNTVRIRCADDDCPDFDLCVTCFSGGAEPMKHKTWHRYRIVKPHTFPIFTEDWDADEELLLIEAARKYGLGNWQAIADYVGTKDRSECEQHYLDVYVSSPDWPMPRMDVKFDELSESECRERKRHRLQQSRGMLPRAKAVVANANKPVTSGPAYHEIQGYMPRRFEFETEYENDAEQYVKDMVFNDDDTQEEIDLKLMVLDIYNSRLDRRAERKRLIFERGWLDFKKMQAAERRRSKEEREVYNRTRVFCRLQTASDYEMLVQGLVREQQLRDRISILQEWRKAGLTSLRQGEQYEKDKQSRLAQLKTLIQLSNDRMGAAAVTQRNTYRAQMAALSATPSGASIFRDSGRSSTPTQSNGSHVNASSSATAAATATSAANTAAAAGARRPANPLDISEADGVHLLTEEEQTLCSTLRILPRPYMVIKDTILKEYARQGYLKRRQARGLIKIDVNKTSRIYDFFIESGWIKSFKGPSSSIPATTQPQPQPPTSQSNLQQQNPSISSQQQPPATVPASSTLPSSTTTTTTTTPATVPEAPPSTTAAPPPPQPSAATPTQASP